MKLETERIVGKIVEDLEGWRKKVNKRGNLKINGTS